MNSPIRHGQPANAEQPDLVAAMLQAEADRAIGRWDELRAQRKAAEEAAEFQRRTETWRSSHWQ